MAGQVEKLVISVSNVAFVNLTDGQGPGVHLHFTGVDSKEEVRLNGYVPVSHAEFFSHSESTESLANLVREKVMAKFEPAQEEPVTE
ncbi:hypothetical protein Q0N12_04175 [Rossellomorea marisflavi]|uniref:hypothetical protein n=1 Tax=Rossellomorea marisflavi TaxID=189381 RepID=UPI00345B3697